VQQFSRQSHQQVGCLTDPQETSCIMLMHLLVTCAQMPYVGVHGTQTLMDAYQQLEYV
jgi:hypothetical protein